MKRFLIVLLTVFLAVAFCACTKQETAPVGEKAEVQEDVVATDDTRGEEPEDKGGVTLIESVDLTEESGEPAEPKEPLGADFQTLEDQYTEHYNAVLSGVTAYAAKMMESAEGIASSVGEVLVYMNTEDTKAHLTAMDEVIAEMEATAQSDVEKEKIESDKAALSIYKDIQSAYENWDSLDSEKQQEIMAYIMALAMSQTTAE